MKINKLIILVLVINLPNILRSQESKEVLFIGNSYIGANNLPEMIEQAAMSTHDQLVYDSNIPGGYRFKNHAVDATTRSKIYSQKWDFIVLQGQSQEASWPHVDLMTEVYPYVKALCDTIRGTRACTKPLFYCTWGRKNGDARNCSYASYLCTYEGMDSALTWTYTYLADTHEASVSPVGPVWRYLRENSNIELYSPDESHPSLEGSYAAACVFYTMIYKKDPTLITWNSSLSSLVADTIKAATKLIVYDSIAKWDFSVDYSDTSVTQVNACTNYTWNGTVYRSSTNSPSKTFTNSFGCDSVAILNLTIDTVNLSVMQLDVELTADESGATYQWLDCLESKLISGATDQSYKAVTNGEYAVIVTNSNGCSDTSACYAVSTIGIIENDFGNDLSLYPNPTVGDFSIDLGVIYDAVTITITDLKGKLIQSKTYNENQLLKLNINEPNGVYILMIESENKKAVIRLVKE